MVPFRGRFPRRKQRSGSPLGGCSPQGRCVPGNLGDCFSGLGANGAVSRASRIRAERRRAPLRGGRRQELPCLFSGRGFRGPGHGTTWLRRSLPFPLGGEDNSHARLLAHLQVCVSFPGSKTKVLTGKRGLAEGEMDKLGCPRSRRAGLGAGGGE